MTMHRGHQAPTRTRRKALHIVLFCTVVLAATESPAQPVDRGEALEHLDRLTPQALADVLESVNPDLQAMAAAADAAMQRIEPAGALGDPMLTYAIAPNTIGSDINVRHIGQLSQPLPWPGKRGLRRAAAAHRAQAAAQAVDAARLELLAVAHGSFAEWHYLHRAIAINAATESLLAELKSVAESRYAAGLGLQQDALQAELEVVLLGERRLALEHERIALRARINALLGRDPTALLPPPGPLLAPHTLPEIQILRSAAVNSHPEVRRVQAQAASAHAQVALADKAFMPDFSANLGYVGTLDPADKRLQIGVSINVPIFREKRRAELAASRSDARRAEYELDARRLEVAADLESAYTHTHHAIEVVRLYDSRLRGLAQSNLDAALANYRSGAGEFLNVVTAQRQQLETEQRYERARADYWRMFAELDKASGGALSEAPVTASARAPTTLDIH